MSCIIFGFTGAGKTHHLRSFEGMKSFSQRIDMDEYIAKKYNVPSVSDLINTRGFDWFRFVELECLKSVPEASLIALGGGAVHADSLDYLGQAFSKGIYIDTSFEICWERIKHDPQRPIAKRGRNYCAKLYESRRKDFLSLKEHLDEVSTICDGYF